MASRLQATEDTCRYDWIMLSSNVRAASMPVGIASCPSARCRNPRASFCGRQHRFSTLRIPAACAPCNATSEPLHGICVGGGHRQSCQRAVSSAGSKSVAASDLLIQLIGCQLHAAHHPHLPMKVQQFLLAGLHLLLWRINLRERCSARCVKNLVLCSVSLTSLLSTRCINGKKSLVVMDGSARGARGTGSSPL